MRKNVYENKINLSRLKEAKFYNDKKQNAKSKFI